MIFEKEKLEKLMEDPEFYNAYRELLAYLLRYGSQDVFETKLTNPNYSRIREAIQKFDSFFPKKHLLDNEICHLFWEILNEIILPEKEKT
ncbi:MAG: hypothetical protein WCT18_03600 [Patescibacteria group bacterium]